MDLLGNEYRLLKVLGSGASGLVYLAEELATGDFVAVKEFLGTRDSTSHFLRELSTLFTLRHPNLVGCSNLIYGGRKKSYLVMEYADGGCLRQELSREGKKSSREARAILVDLLNGLSVLHENDIVHCDLKPENVLIFNNQSERPVYKLTDLGISRFRASSQSAENPGSPMYMAPEQFYDGATEASDVYSLGVIYYEMLTGGFLFDGDPEQLFLRHLNDEPDFSNIACPKSRKLCQKMLSKSPSSRPRNAQAVLDLKDHLWDESGCFPIVPLQNLTFDNKIDRFKLLGEKEIAGATRLSPGLGNKILISRHSGTDLLDLDKDAIKPLYFADSMSASHCSKDNQVMLAGSRWVYRLEGRNRLRPLFKPRTTIRDLTRSEDGGRIYYSDGQKLCCMSPLGEQIWARTVPNYFLSPKILLGDKKKTVLATSGPSNPCIHAFDSHTGKQLGQLSLPSPCFGLNTAPEGAYFAYLLPDDREQLSTVALITDELQILDWFPLPGCCSKARFLGELEIVFAPGQLAARKSPEEEWLSLDTDGTPFDAHWCGDSKLLTLLVQREQQVILQRWNAHESLVLSRKRKEAQNDLV